MVHWLELVYFLVLAQGLGRCLYYWQLKEYRLDRFRDVKFAAYWLPSYRLLLPRLTIKILLLIFLTVYLSLWLVWWLAYLLVPLTTAVSVALIAPLSDLIKWLVIILAKIKLLIFHRRLLVIGVTGSYGKTSTKEILAHVLTDKFLVAKTPGTNNTLIGVALTVLIKLPRNAQVFVVEMGAYKVGEITSICRLVKPKIGILTGINEQHLDLFGSRENIIRAKSELLLALPKTGLAVINGVNPITKKLKAGQAPIKHYRFGKFKTNLLGVHQQLNIGAAIAVARYLGVEQFDLTHIPQFKTAITQTNGLNGALIINDSYNSNPDGFLAAVDLAKTIPAKKKILISPGIIELGRASETVHQRLLTAAKTVFDCIFMAEPEKPLLRQMEKILTKNHLLLIEGRFSKKFIKKLCLKNQS